MAADPEERQRRMSALVEEIKEGQAALGSPSPFIPFLNLVTAFIVDTEMRLDKIEAALTGMDGFESPAPQLQITQVEKGQHG